MSNQKMRVPDSGRIRSLKTEKKYNWKGRRVQILPKLVIQGAWFLQAGFQPGERVSLSVSNCLIIIKPENHVG